MNNLPVQERFPIPHKPSSVKHVSFAIFDPVTQRTQRIYENYCAEVSGVANNSPRILRRPLSVHSPQPLHPLDHSKNKTQLSKEMEIYRKFACYFQQPPKKSIV